MTTDITKPPMAHIEMLIRRPVAVVFEAFIDPAVTTNFWFTRSSGRLEADREVTWYWDMYGVSTVVLVKVIEPNRRIVVEWDGYDGRTTVEWNFFARDDATTYVVVAESGFKGEPDELLKYIADSTQGFALMIAGLKAFLEHGVKLDLVADKSPDAHKEGWQQA